jgi:transposase
MRRVRETGSLEPAQIGGYRRPVLEPHEALLRELADGKDITLAEIQAELSRRVGLTPDRRAPPIQIAAQ